MSINGQVGRRTKVTRIVCSRAKEARSCSNRRPYTLDHIESTVLSGLQARLADTRAISYFVDVYNDERRQLVASAGADRTKIEARLQAVGKEIDRSVDLVIKGVLAEDEVRGRLDTLRKERVELQGRLAATPDAPKVIALRPTLVARYLDGVQRLDRMLANKESPRPEVAGAVRDLVSKVTVFPPEEDGTPEILVEGYLSSLVETERNHGFKRRGGSVVEGRELGTNPLQGVPVAT